MAIERLFSGQTPANINSDEGTGVVLATGFTVDVEGNIIGIEFYTPTTLAASYVLQLYLATDHDDAPGTGILLGEGTISSGLSSETWTDVMLDEPVPVFPDVYYKTCYHASNGRHNGTPNFFNAVDLVSGNITAWRNGSDPVGLGSMRNGTYSDSATPIYPNDYFGATCYFVGPIFDNDPETFTAHSTSALLTF
jgi:hypothetical protein